MRILTREQCEARVRALAVPESATGFEFSENDYLDTIKFLREELNIARLQRDAKRWTDGTS
jgi:hypothetical protein